MNTHALFARTRRGATIEVGQVGSLEAAVRLQRAIESCPGERFACWIEELDVEWPAPTVRSVTFAELQREVARRGYGELLHIARRR